MGMLVSLLAILAVLVTTIILTAMGISYSRSKWQLRAGVAAAELTTGPSRRADAVVAEVTRVGVQARVTFSLADKTLLNFPVADSEAESLRPGDRAIVEWAGSRLIRFETLR
ncbi:MAG: hypothetical protein LBR32_05790 [Propionibacteriaceae bacterium]|nr:hypothetical protein [Propionibacteriaceae bacterium]